MNEAVRLLSKRLSGLLIKRPGLAVGIWGEAGIGKTHTVSSLLRDTPCRNLSVHATLPVVQLVQRLPQPKSLPVWAERILGRVQAGEFVEPSSLIDLLGALLSGLAPLVIHLEDLHEASQDSLEFVQTLAALVKRLKGVGLLVTSRTLPPEALEAIRLELGSSEDTKAMLEVEAGSGLPDECVAWIQARAAGNPLFTLEFFHFLARQGFVWSDGKHWHWRTPDRAVMPVTVEALIEQRLRQATQSPTLEVALAAKAMLPIGSSTELWAAVTGLPLEDLQGACLELERQGLLLGDGFAHPLYREIVRQNISNKQQQELSQRIIRVLEQEPERAARFALENKLEPEEAFELFERAAQQAQKQGDGLRSARWQARAAVLCKDEAGLELAFNAATGLRDHDPITALELTRQVLEVRPDDARALLLEVVLLAQQQQGDQALVVLERLPDEVKNSPEGLETAVYVLGLTDRFDQLFELWKRNSFPQYRGVFLRALADKGLTGEAIQLGEQGLHDPLLLGFPRLQLMGGLAEAYRLAGEYEQAEHLNSQVIEVLLNEHNARRVYVMYGNRSVARRWAGQIKAALADAHEALRYASEAGDTFHVALSLCGVGGLLMEFAEYQQAEDHLSKARAMLEQRDSSPNLVDTENNLSELYRNWAGLAHGGVLSLKHARSALRCARSIEGQRSLVASLFYGSLCEAHYGQVSTALEHIQELEGFTTIDSRTGYWIAWAQGYVFEKQNQPAESLAAFQTAVRQANKVKNEFDAKTVELEVARLSNDSQLARALLQWFEERGLQNGMNIARRYFPELGASAHTMPRLEPTKPARLGVLGPMQLGNKDKTEPVRGRKRQELLALLLEARIAGRSEIPRLELIDLLYPDSDEAHASSSLKANVRLVRASLGADAIQTTQHGYALGAVSSDAETFLKTGEAKLWRGAYLEGLPLEASDQTVRESLHLALFARAQALLESDPLENDPLEAARVGKILLAFDAYNLEYLNLCVTALRLGNNHKSLTRLYAQTRLGLLEVGEVLPERWQDFLTQVAHP